MFNRGFANGLSADELSELIRRAHTARGTVLTATTLAVSGHPGGSLSSMELYTVLHSCARVRPSEPRWEDRDRIVVSHGHTSPGVYSALAEAGFFDPLQVAAHFRQADSLFEGHVERSVPGVEWSTGNLGQGLSAGVGLALGAQMTGGEWHTFVAMSDGEQQKGQVGEARRLAAKYGLANVTAVVDWNRVQISGHTDEVMPVPIHADWEADGWRTIECDGHDIEALYAAIADGVADGVPTAILAHTVIGKGVSFMEDDRQYHGRGLNADEYTRAMAELGLDPAVLEAARTERANPVSVAALETATEPVPLKTGTPRTYEADAKTDNRSAWGTALLDIADENPETAVTVLDCDLAESVKTATFWAKYPQRFVECGVGEHNTATVAGALSTVPGAAAYWADFGVFGIDEVYNQQRLNDINGAALKLTVTHCGLDVGEDGKTHQCLDYVGALRNLFGWRVFVPADPNQTDRVVRAVATMQGNVAVAMGRSKLPIILDESGDPLFGGDYEFTAGEIVWARDGRDAALLAMGTLAGTAVNASDLLRSRGVGVAVGIVAAPLELDSAAMSRTVESKLLVTVEDHSVRSGLGASVAEWLADNAESARLVTLGVPDYWSSGASADLFALAGLDAESIAERIERELQAV